MALASGTRLGPYEILALIGEGGMGEVYRATDTRLDRIVAVKVSKEQFSDRFEREARVIAHLSHPNICILHDVGPNFLVMEFVEGQTLGERMAAGPMPIEAALPIARQIAEALDAAHEKGVIHRDLKPANVKITPEGTVKVLDFGLARAMDNRTGQDPSTTPTLTISMGGTQAGVILGSAGYLSPEQARGIVADKRADVWSFGVVLFEMLTGKRLFDGETLSDMLAAVLKTDPDWKSLPEGMPPPVERMLRRCLERDRRKRRRDIGDVILEIDEAMAWTPPAPVEAIAAPAPPRGRPWAWIAAAAVLGIGALALGFVHFREAPPVERVLRYTVDPPAKSQIHTFALSPDGRYLAIAANLDGRRRLWVRPLDALASQELRGTDGAIYPFWSPDSRNIGFFAGGKLKKVTIEGAPPQVLCDAPDGRGGTWNREDVIVFAPTNNGVLQRVAAVGGVPAAVTKEDGEIHRFPHFLPDGRQFLYDVSNRTARAGQGILAGSLDGGTPRLVVADDSSGVWVPASGGPSGHLLFQRSRTLMAQPIDGASLQPTGDMFPVVEQVSLVNLTYALASSSSNGVLAYWNAGDTRQQQLAWYDRSGKPAGAVGKARVTRGVSLSPDGKIIATAVSAEPGTDVWLHDLARGNDIRLTFGQLDNNRNPVWSPDGNKIVYSCESGGVSNLCLKETNGNGREEVLLKPANRRFPTDWSRDGKVVLYSELDGNRNLMSLEMTGDRKTTPFAATPFNETQGKFSPDGRWVAYASDESGRYEVYVRPFPSGPGKWKVSQEGGELPRWRADGREMYYLSPGRKLIAVPVKPSPGAQPGFDVGSPEVLFEPRVRQFAAGFVEWPYDVSADGKRILVDSPLGGDADAPLTIVVNWLAAVKK